MGFILLFPFIKTFKIFILLQRRRSDKTEKNKKVDEIFSIKISTTKEILFFSFLLLRNFKIFILMQGRRTG
jgi:hypothetical protein